VWTSAFVSVKNRENSKNPLLLGQLFITRENSSALRSGSHSVFWLKPYTLNYSSLTRRGGWCWEITHSLCNCVWKSCGVEIKHDNKIMEMSVMVHMRHPWKYS